MLALCAPLTAAHAAPGVTLDQYRAPAASSDGFATARPEVGPHLQFEARLSLDYAHDPLVFEARRGDSKSQTVALVSDQLAAQLGVSLALFDRLLIFASTPINLVMEGTPLGAQPTATGFGGGDFGFGARGVFVRGEAGALGLELAATLPTGAGSKLGPAVAGDASASFAPALIGELSLGPVRLAGNVGLRWHKVVILPDARFANQLTYALALSVPLLRDVLRAQAEVFGSTLSADAGLRESTPLEALLGLKLWPNPSWTAGLAGGFGLLRGYGSPDLRIIAQLAWHTLGQPVTPSAPSEPALVPEGIADPEPMRTPPPLAASDSATDEAGEPPVAKDSDHDTLPDSEDACPALPGAAEHAGCPEHVGYAKDSGALTLSPPPSFSRAGAELVPSSSVALSSLANALASNRRLRVMIAVHLDPQAKLDLAAVSEARARALATALTTQGVNTQQIEAYACAGNRPVTMNKREHAMNERIELYLTQPLPELGMPSSFGCSPLQLPPSAAAAAPLAHDRGAALLVRRFIRLHRTEPEPATAYGDGTLHLQQRAARWEHKNSALFSLVARPRSPLRRTLVGRACLTRVNSRRE